MASVDLSFVEKKPPKFSNPLVQNHRYSKVGKNAILDPRPAVVHFGGFSIHSLHRQTLRILNISSQSQRIHILPPSSVHFRINMDKRGMIAPGMSEDIHIEFLPTEWRYYYDCIRVHCDAENLLVPIHGYPVMNQVIFPKRIDFGVCPLGQETIKIIKLECQVPIQFEFEFRITKPHSDFSVSPIRGIVPPNGETEVTIRFTPVKISTSQMKIQVNVSQFGFEPFECEIVGSSTAGLTREMLGRTIKQNNVEQTVNDQIEQKTEKIIAENTDVSHLDADTLRETVKKITKQSGNPQIPEAMLSSTKPKVSLDPVASYLENNAVKRGKFSKMKSQPLDQETSIEIDGYIVPRNIDNVSAINDLLTQQPGKLKIRDLKKAIEDQKEAQKRKVEEQQALRLAQGEEVDGAPDNVDAIINEESGSISASRQIREMVFLQDLKKIDEEEKRRELQPDREFLGKDFLDEFEIEAILEAREQRIANKDSRDRLQLLSLLENSTAGPQDSVPERVKVPFAFECIIIPDFSEFKNDPWRSKKLILKKFIAAVTKVVIRNRANSRIQAIKEKLSGFQTREQVKQLVDIENRLAQTYSNNPSEKQFNCDVNSAVMHEGFPLVVENIKARREPIKLSLHSGFEDFTLFKMQIARESTLFGYQKQSRLVSPYVSREIERKTRQGALEECIPLDLIDCPPIKPMEVPLKSTKQTEPEKIEILDEDLSCFTAPELCYKSGKLAPVEEKHPATISLTRLVRFDETDTNAGLRPQAILRPDSPSRGSQTMKDFGCSSMLLEDTQTISQFWRPTRGLPDGWELTEMPQKISCFRKIDAMEDSDSEDEKAEPLYWGIPNPTPEMASTLFETQTDLESSEKGKGQLVRQSSSTLRTGEQFAEIVRDRKFLLLENHIRLLREEQSGRIVDLLRRVNENIALPSHELLTEIEDV